MRRIFMTAIAASVLAACRAQSLKVITRGGETAGFNLADVERVEFRATPLPDPDPEPVTIDFMERMTAIVPEEGIIDPDLSENGLGRISIAMDGAYMVDTDAAKRIVLATPSDTVFSRKADDAGMYLYRDMMSGKTEFSYMVDPDGFRTPGVYHLYIPEGTYTDTEGNPLGATTRVYIISDPAPAQRINTVPAQGQVERLESVTFTFGSYPQVQPVDSPEAYLYKDGASMPDAVLALEVGPDGVAAVSLNPAVTAGGLYRISIPEGAFALRMEEGGKPYPSAEVDMYFEIGGGTLPSPRLGDFYYSDGSWSPYPVDKGDVKPVGIIFYVGEATRYGDSASRYMLKGTDRPMEELHGYVVALQDATWHDGAHHAVAWSFWDGSDVGCGCSEDVTDFSGYGNTRSICERAERDFGGLSGDETNFPATWHAVSRFDEVMPSPSSSSGWFLPSAGQMAYIYENVYFDPNNGNPDARYVERSLAQVGESGGMPMYDRGSSYWTSTEEYDAYGMSYRARYFSFDSTVIRPGFVGWANKGAHFRVRPMLAF